MKKADLYNIVLLDDDHELLNVLTMTLEEEFNVSAFSEPSVCAEWLRKEKMNAVVIDYHLKQQNGCDFYKHIREFGYQGPVLFLSGELDPIAKIECLKLGVDDYVLKPVSFEVLSAHINNRIKHYELYHPNQRRICERN